MFLSACDQCCCGSDGKARKESNACLVRANVGSGKTSVLIEKIRFLQEQKGIPFQDIPVLAWFLQILRFLGNHKDIISAISVLSNKSFGEDWTQKKARSEVLSFVHGDIFLSRSPLFQRMWEYQDEGKDYEKLWDFLDLEIYLPPISADYEENKRCILDLLKAMGNYESIREFLNEITLNGMDMTHHTVQMPSVQLMTLHASKGLEFDYVFIIGVNDGLIPLHSKDAAAEEEERRLFYVGMTRARKFLELSFYTSPDRNGIYPGPGLYLSYLPEQYLSNGIRKQRNQKEAAEHLQEMKRMILEERNRNVNVQKEPEEKPESDQNEIVDKIYEHPKYGRGVILDENEDIIRIRFDDYGEKELLKAFLHN